MKEKDKIKHLCYTDFVAYVEQWNVPPGSLSTISEWKVFGGLDQESKVLEIACTTGFSGRELAKMTGCSVHGIDISQSSIEKAKKAAEIYAPECDLTYECIDFYDYVPLRKYTHIILGASIQFFSDRNKVIEKISELLVDGGIILASPYYLKNKPLNKELIQRAQKIIGIDPTNFDYYTAMDYYKNFEILYQSRKDIYPENLNQMEKYVSDTVARCCELNKIEDDEIKQRLYERLYEIKDVCNQLHVNHAYSVLVLRYTKKVYPRRFVELF